MATDVPEPPAGTGHGPDPRPPDAAARHPAPPGPGEHRPGGEVAPAPRSPPWLRHGAQVLLPLPRGRDVPEFYQEGLNPEIPVAVAVRVGAEAQIATQDQENTNPICPGRRVRQSRLLRAGGHETGLRNAR